MNRRAFLLGSVLLLPPVLSLSTRTHAAVSVLLSLEELVDRSSQVVVATPTERRSQWEDLPSGRRIVTYTKVAVERSVAGAGEKEIWVRTLGGVVGKIGQTVAGEAQLTIGSRAMLFLAPASGAVVVTGMAQGHFPIVIDDKGAARLGPSPDPGMLVPRRGPAISAHERLVGGKLEDAVALVAQARKARDANK